MNTDSLASAGQELPTTGTVVLKTSYGELEIELWSQEAPKACKNFIQLCLEGYYNDLPFHRLIPGFLIQTGDPTGTGNGGQSIYGKPFPDEFNMRLKFTHRGLLGMATTSPNSNQSQFFITFGPADGLYKKHTLFGRITGDTIYNLMAMEKLDTNTMDQPITPPVILGTQVLLNPFDDVYPREPTVVYSERLDYYHALNADKSQPRQGEHVGIVGN